MNLSMLFSKGSAVSTTLLCYVAIKTTNYMTIIRIELFKPLTEAQLKTLQFLLIDCEIKLLEVFGVNTVTVFDNTAHRGFNSYVASVLVALKNDDERFAINPEREIEMIKSIKIENEWNLTI